MLLTGGGKPFGLLSGWRGVLADTQVIFRTGVIIRLNECYHKPTSVGYRLDGIIHPKDEGYRGVFRGQWSGLLHYLRSGNEQRNNR